METQTNKEHTPDVLPTYQDIVRQNTTGTVPEQFLGEHRVDYGLEPVPVERYRSQAFHDKEVEHVWKRVWQFACFEDDIPNIGDYTLYEICGISIVVVRSGPGEISAFYNSCLHRASALCTTDGNTSQFRCPYHGWCYSLDGTLEHVPAQWDFPQVRPGRIRIQSIKVETWDGFVFVNLDRDALPLGAYLDPVPGHFQLWPFKGRHRSAWVAKVLPVNWKAALDGFAEGYHLPVVHPQAGKMCQQYEMQYDIVGTHVGRILFALAAPNFITGPDVSEQELADGYTDALGMDRVELRPGQTARSALAERVRAMLGAFYGLDTTGFSDPEVLDSPEYVVFPNLVLWGGYAIPWVYRFRPNGNDPESSIMEVIQLTPFPPGQEAPANAPLHLLGRDEPFASATELGVLGSNLDQDFANMVAQEVGLRSTPRPAVMFSQYQESVIRHTHKTLDRYIAGA